MCMRYTSVYSTEMAELQHTKEAFTGQDAKGMCCVSPGGRCVKTLKGKSCCNAAGAGSGSCLSAELCFRQ